MSLRHLPAARHSGETSPGQKQRSPPQQENDPRQEHRDQRVTQVMRPAEHLVAARDPAEGKCEREYRQLPATGSREGKEADQDEPTAGMGGRETPPASGRRIVL